MPQEASPSPAPGNAGRSLRGPGWRSRRAGAGPVPMAWPEAKQMVPVAPWRRTKDTTFLRPCSGERKPSGLRSRRVNLVPSVSRLAAPAARRAPHFLRLSGHCVSVCETITSLRGAHRKRGLQGRSGAAVILGSNSAPRPAAQVSCSSSPAPEDEAFRYNNRLRAHGGGAGTTWAGTPVRPGALGGSVLGQSWGAGVGEGEAEEGAAERPWLPGAGPSSLSSRSRDSPGVTHEIPGRRHSQGGSAGLSGGRMFSSLKPLMKWHPLPWEQRLQRRRELPPRIRAPQPGPHNPILIFKFKSSLIDERCRIPWKACSKKCYKPGP